LTESNRPSSFLFGDMPAFHTLPDIPDQGDQLQRHSFRNTVEGAYRCHRRLKISLYATLCPTSVQNLPREAIYLPWRLLFLFMLDRETALGLYSTPVPISKNFGRNGRTLIAGAE